jgi:hypothetical protein
MKGDENNLSIPIREFIVGLIFLAASIIFFIFSIRLEGRARLFPSIISSALIIFSSVFSLQQLILISKRRKSFPKSILNDKSREFLTNNGRLNIFLLIIPGLALGFISLLPYIGFEASGFILMFTIMLIINSHLAIKKIHFAIIIPIMLNLTFKFALNIHLPSTWELFFY